MCFGVAEDVYTQTFKKNPKKKNPDCLYAIPWGTGLPTVIQSTAEWSNLIGQKLFFFIFYFYFYTSSPVSNHGLILMY